MNTIEETIKLAGFGRKRVMKKQIKIIRKNLHEGEKLLGVAASFPKPMEQLFVSNNKVIVHKIEGLTDNKSIEIPISTIKSVKVKSADFGAEIKVSAPNNSATVVEIPLDVAKEIKKLIDSLRKA
ncbi:PH domain-containing protein [Virgibacillus necropolis]|uniref:PH domain-containing protein n=1 Tax=Virgibacillus necropolis TaxID=163877 RepID=UPI00384DAC13